MVEDFIKTIKKDLRYAVPERPIVAYERIDNDNANTLNCKKLSENAVDYFQV